MLIDRSRVPVFFTFRDFERGRTHYEKGRVQSLRVKQDGEETGRIECMVQGKKRCGVIIQLVHGEITWKFCSCRAYGDELGCEHMAAAMLACADEDGIQMGRSLTDSDSRARSMLRAYTEKSARQLQKSEDRPVRLVPRLCPVAGAGGYPAFTFQVGFERLYVVQDVRKFVESVIRRETVSYGKGLRFCHDPERFEPEGRELISILLDQLAPGRGQRGEISNRTYEKDLLTAGGARNQVLLSGSGFDRLFTLYQNRRMGASSGEAEYAFAVRDPQTSLSLESADGAARLHLEVEEGGWTFFGSPQELYAMGQGQVLRCSREFRDRVYPLVKTGAESMRLSFRDLPTFCGCVLPEIQDLVSIEDPAQLLQEYLPDACVPCFCFDLEEGMLTLTLEYRYDEVRFNCFERPGQAVKRDVRTEQAAQALAEAYFSDRAGARFVMADKTSLYAFLSEKLDRFQEAGEVYLSDSLLAKRIRPSRSAVGVSVSDGRLLVDIDTGGFPPEELEALYQSLIKRKRYHLLADGRFLPLDGSSCETLSEMAHMLQLSPGELKEGHLEMPASRALYLNSLLSGRENLQFRRDQWFRELIRNFKSVPEGGYALPEGLEDVLRPYQKEGFQWLKTLGSYHYGGILADEMGLGKTLQVIAYLASLSPAEREGPSLVVCPASLILNWADELDKFAPALTYTLVMGTAKERAARIAGGGERAVWVTSYELLRQDIEQYAPLRFTCCILDEGQHIKNQSTLASKAVKRINCRQRFVMTGTPIENRLSELWNLFDFLMPGYLFSYDRFVERLEKPAVKDGSEEAMEQLRRLVRPFLLRRLKKDVLKELPPKLEYVRRIPLSEEERTVYAASSAAVLQRLAVEEGEGGKLEVLAALTELRQICCAPALRFENYRGPSSKLEACMELCAGLVENGHQILLFSQFTSMLDRIRERLDGLGISHFTLQGSTPKARRAQLVKAFNDGGASVFLISLKAGGTGLNLTAADVVIHYDPWWNPAAQDQATDRAHRIGQHASVQVYKLIAENTIEEKILLLQDRKAELMDAVAGGAAGGLLEMSREELLALL